MPIEEIVVSTPISDDELSSVISEYQYNPDISFNEIEYFEEEEEADYESDSDSSFEASKARGLS